MAASEGSRRRSTAGGDGASGRLFRKTRRAAERRVRVLLTVWKRPKTGSTRPRPDSGAASGAESVREAGKDLKPQLEGLGSSLANRLSTACRRSGTDPTSLLAEPLAGRVPATISSAAAGMSSRRHIASVAAVSRSLAIAAGPGSGPAGSLRFVTPNQVVVEIVASAPEAAGACRADPDRAARPGRRRAPGKSRRQPRLDSPGAASGGCPARSQGRCRA